MSVTHLLDTSVVKRLGNPAVAAVVRPMLQAQTAARPRIVDLEVGYSARTAREWDRYLEAVAVLGRIATTADHVERALVVQRMLADRSQRGRKIPDLLVAAAAEAHGLTVLHYDADFDLIAAVTSQPVEWVVPAGSID